MFVSTEISLRLSTLGSEIWRRENARSWLVSLEAEAERFRDCTEALEDFISSAAANGSCLDNPADEERAEIVHWLSHV